jgi:hypothetical protein
MSTNNTNSRRSFMIQGTAAGASLAVAPGDPISPALLPTLVDGGGGYFGPNAAPGPLPLLGASAGWAWSRRLRARSSSGPGRWRP